jgi:hypothetical protein
MRYVQLSEQLYQEVQRRAAEAGFPSVDENVAEVLQQDSREEPNLGHLFTPERLAHIDRALAEIKAGKGLTSEQVREHFAKRRVEWVRQNPT